MVTTTLTQRLLNGNIYLKFGLFPQHYGFHLPREILIFLYNDAQQAAENHPSFIFSSSISPEQCGSTWCNEALLERLLPRIEQVEALHLNKTHSVDDATKKGVPSFRFLGPIPSNSFMNGCNCLLLSRKDETRFNLLSCRFPQYIFVA